jgi:hypothetical protein
VDDWPKAIAPGFAAKVTVGGGWGGGPEGLSVAKNDQCEPSLMGEVENIAGSGPKGALNHASFEAFVTSLTNARLLSLAKYANQ